MTINKTWHLKNKMPKNPSLAQRIKWHQEHAKHCACWPIPSKLLSAHGRAKPVNHYFLGAQFLQHGVKQGWLKQEGKGGRGTKWYVTRTGKTALKEKFNIKI